MSHPSQSVLPLLIGTELRGTAVCLEAGLKLCRLNSVLAVRIWVVAVPFRLNKSYPSPNIFFVVATGWSTRLV